MDEAVEVLRKDPESNMKATKAIERLLARCEHLGKYDLVTNILNILLKNAFIFNHIRYFDCLKPLIAAGQFELPIIIIWELIQNKFAGLASQRPKLEQLVVLIVKENQHDLDDSIKLFNELKSIPDVVNNYFITSLLNALKERNDWDHYKIVLKEETILDAWELMINWAIESDEQTPNIRDGLQLLEEFRDMSTNPDSVPKLYNYMGNWFLREALGHQDPSQMDIIFEDMLSKEISISSQNLINFFLWKYKKQNDNLIDTLESFKSQINKHHFNLLINIVLENKDLEMGH